MKYSILHSPCGMIDAIDIYHTKKAMMFLIIKKTMFFVLIALPYIYIYIAFRFLAFLDHVTMEQDKGYIMNTRFWTASSADIGLLLFA